MRYVGIRVVVAMALAGCVPSGGGGGGDGGSGGIGGGGGGGGGGGMGGGGAGACQLVGDRFEIGTFVTTQVAAVDGGYVVYADDFIGSQKGSFFIADGMVTPLDTTPIGGPNAHPALAGDGTEARGATFDGFWQQSGLRTYAFVEGAWGDDPFNTTAGGRGQNFTSGSDIALASDGALWAIWSEGLSDDRAVLAMHIAVDGTETGPIALSTDDMSTSGYDVHIAADASGGAHALMVGTGSAEAADAELVYWSIDAAGAASAPSVIGPAVGSLANVIVSDIVNASGAFYVAEVNAGPRMSFDPGALNVYRKDGDAFVQVGSAVVDAHVADGLSMTPLSGDAVAISYTTINNTIGEDSEDTVTLVRCAADGCAEPIAVRDQTNTFYDRTAIAAHGDEGLVVWNEQRKQSDDDEVVWGQHFRCDH